MIESLNFDIQKPSVDLSKITMLLYGVPKIGKSTFCSRFDDHFFIATEPGLSHLEARFQLVQSWAEIRQTVAILKANRDKFKTLIIDTVDRMCDFLEREILKKYSIQCLNDLGYGKGTAIFRNNLKLMIDELNSIGAGLIFTSHSESVEITTPTGAIKKWGPSIPKDARKQILNAVDVIGFAECEYSIDGGKQKEQRVLHLAPSQIWEAGDRTHRFPAKIPFKQAVFKQYFEKNSQQTQQTNEVTNG